MNNLNKSCHCSKKIVLLQTNDLDYKHWLIVHENKIDFLLSSSRKRVQELRAKKKALLIWNFMLVYLDNALDNVEKIKTLEI